MSRTYTRLLALPGAAAFSAAAGAGRVGVAMTSLGLLWLVRERTGSYAAAAAVVAAFAVAEALVGPQVARVVDAVGQPRALLVVAPAHALAVALQIALVGGGAPAGLLVAGGVLVGASVPQPGALAGARWVALLAGRRDDLLAPAFSWESTVNASAFLAGPVLVSVLAQGGRAVLGSAVAGALVAGGTLALAALRSTAPTPAAGPRRAAGRDAGPTSRGLLDPAFLVVVGLTVAVGGFFGSSQVAVTAFAGRTGASAATLLALSGVAGLLAGWAYGRRTWATRPRHQLVLLGAVLLLACTWPAVALGPVPVAGGLVVAGAVVPPVLVLCSLAVQRAVPAAVLTRALTWVNSAAAAGSAVAAAVAGALVDGAGPAAGFAVGAVAAAGFTALALVTSRSRPALPRR